MRHNAQLRLGASSKRLASAAQFRWVRLLALIGISWLVVSVDTHIFPVIELSKEMFHHGVINRFQNIIRL